MNEKKKSVSVIDKAIIVFSVIFLASINNSIFINQLGYYGALLLILVRFFVTKENRFPKTGLEIAFILFFAAELISAIFSVNQPQAFNNLLKRMLLIPIVYTMAAAADDLDKAKLFVKVYLGFAVASIAVYAVFAYEHFISQLYRIEGKGPSPFQYVMTAGGLISFTVVFLFAFLVNEKTGIRNRLFYIAAFLLSSAALFASYTRAAWIGTAAGLAVILLAKRKWIILGGLTVLMLVFIFLQKNKSSVSVYEYNGKEISRLSGFSTEGRAFDTYSDSSRVIVADYNKGLMVFKPGASGGLSAPAFVKTASPVVSIARWKDGLYLSTLIDQRFIILGENNGTLKQVKEFVSPGYLFAYALGKNYFYTGDRDSGITVFRNPMDLGDKVRFPQLNQVKRMHADSAYLAYTTDDSRLIVFSLKNGLPDKKILDSLYKTNFGFPYVVGNNLLFADESGLKLFGLDSAGIRLKSVNSNLTTSFYFTEGNGRLFSLNTSGLLSELKLPEGNGDIQIINQVTLPFTPASFKFADGKFYFTEMKVSRISSIADPYHPTNIQRMYQWRAGWEILKDHPFFGVGDIDMNKIYRQYMYYFERETYGHLHNNFVQLLAILGIFGFAAVMYMLGKIFFIHVKIYRNVSNVPFASSYALGALASFAAFLVSGLAEWNFGDHEIITVVWFTLGLNLAFYNALNIKNGTDKNSSDAELSGQITNKSEG